MALFSIIFKKNNFRNKKLYTKKEITIWFLKSISDKINKLPFLDHEFD